VPRPSTPVGSFGAIAHSQLPDGTWSARTHIRVSDGKLRSIKRRARSRAAAERALRIAIAERTPPSRDTLKATIRIRDVAECWYVDVRQDVTDGTKSPNTARLYRHYLDRHILPGIGDLRLSEATVPRLDEFITAVRKRSGVAAAKACRSALSGMLGQAARRGAIPTNLFAISAACPACAAPSRPAASPSPSASAGSLNSKPTPSPCGATCLT
jgi:hypothetical protein